MRSVKGGEWFDQLENYPDTELFGADAGFAT
jgi:hypothetical protein